MSYLGGHKINQSNIYKNTTAKFNVHDQLIIKKMITKKLGFVFTVCFGLKLTFESLIHLKVTKEERKICKMVNTLDGQKN